MPDIPQQEYDGKCHALRVDGQPCDRLPRKGAVVCPSHGGELPQVKTAAAQRNLKLAANARMRRKGIFGKQARLDYVAEAERNLQSQIQFKDALEELVSVDSLRYEGKTGEQIRGEVQLLTNAWRDVQNGIVAYYKLGLEEKRIELEKAKADLVAGAIRAILARLELSVDQKRLAPMIIKEELLALSAKES